MYPFKFRNYPFVISFIIGVLFFTINASAQNLIATYGSVTRPVQDFYGYNGTNTVRIFGWENAQLPAAVNSLNPGMLRYPGGAYANWWDWKSGWFKTQDDMPPGIVLPGKYILSYSFDDRLEQYKKSVDASGAAPIFVLNMISSTLEDQVAMLYHAQCMNLPVKYIELGKEFYDDDPSILLKYLTAESYAADILLWTNELKKHFPDAKIAFVTAYEYNNDSSPYSRRKSWNTRVTDQLALYGASYPVASSAGTMYMFQSTGNPGVNAPISTPAQVDNVMESAYKILDHLQSTELPHLTFTPELWVTEVNMMDQAIGVHGTWAHGLFSVLTDMRFLENTKIKRALIHNLIGDAIYSALFDDSLGFCFAAGADGAGFIPPIPTGSTCNQYQTNAMEKTAIGNALAQMGTAMFKSDEAKNINITNAPLIPGTAYKSVYGWQFRNTGTANSEQLIILNLSGTSQTLDIASLSLGGNLAIQQLDGSPYTPIQGNLSATSSSVTGNTFTLTPYSITRVYKNGISSLFAFAVSDTICTGGATSLHARGATSYTWSPSAGLSNTSGPDVDAFPSSTTTYTVTDNFGNSKQITLTVVNVNPVIISGLPSGKICQGQTLNLTASGSNMFNWFPKTLTSNSNNSAVSIAPQTTTTYTVNGNDGMCWCGELTFTIQVAGEVALGSDHLICSGTPDTLVTGNNTSFGYLWTSSDGSLNSTLPQPVVSPIDTTSYYLQASELGCTYYDTLIVNTMNCCTGNISVVNSNVDDLASEVAAVCAACVETGNTVTIRNYSGDIFINGILTMEKNLKFVNCASVRFNHAGKINILQNYKLTLDSGSVLKDCNNEMWQGISLYDANSNVKVYNGATIMNSEIGIDCSIDSKLFLENANFIDNYTDVKLHDYLKPFIGTIFGSDFIGSGNNSLIAPHIGQRAACHIHISDIVSVKIGDSQESPNTFSYFDSGIKADSVELTIKNCHFQNFDNTLPAGSSFNGVALDILGTNETIHLITVGGTGANEKLTFLDGYLGINATGIASLNITGNYFNNLYNAVYASYCSEPLLGTSIDILQDSITNCNHGITSYYNSNSIININQNYIGINPDSSTGIAVEDSLSGTTSEVNINQNRINNSDSRGIYLNQPGHNASVFENEIFVSVPQSLNYKSTGIKVYNSDSISVLHNLVACLNSSNGYDNTYGIFIQNSTQSDITDNSLNYLERGINCNGAGMNSSRIKCNVFNSCKKGLALENSCVLGQQGDSIANIPWNNQWVPGGYYDAGNPNGYYSVYSFNSNGNFSKFFTRSAFPYSILSSGASGLGIAIPYSYITGTGTVCLPPFNTGIDYDSAAPLEFTVFPNPASKELHINLSNFGNLIPTINIYNVLGEIVITPSSDYYSNEVIVNLNNIPSGIYIIIAVSDNGILSKKEFAVIKN